MLLPAHVSAPHAYEMHRNANISFAAGLKHLLDPFGRCCKEGSEIRPIGQRRFKKHTAVCNVYPCDRQIQEDYHSAFVSDWCGWHGSSTYGRPSDLYSLIGICFFAFSGPQSVQSIEDVLQGLLGDLKAGSAGYDGADCAARQVGCMTQGSFRPNLTVTF